MRSCPSPASYATPLYGTKKVAHEFADLHDRSGRMKAKGVVRDILEWKSSREYFYWRVKRRLAENEVRKMFNVADPSQSFDKTTELMQVRWGCGGVLTHDSDAAHGAPIRMKVRVVGALCGLRPVVMLRVDDVLKILLSERVLG